MSPHWGYWHNHPPRWTEFFLKEPGSRNSREKIGSVICFFSGDLWIMIAKKTAMLDVVSKLQLLEVKNKKISCAAARSRKAMINPLLGNRSGFFFHSKPNLNSSAHSCQMDVSKNNDTPKWITLLKWMIWGFYPPIFGSTPKSKNQDAKVRMLTSSCFEVEKTTKVSAASTFLPRKICTPRESSRKPTKMSPKKKKKTWEVQKWEIFGLYTDKSSIFHKKKKLLASSGSFFSGDTWHSVHFRRKKNSPKFTVPRVFRSNCSFWLPVWSSVTWSIFGILCIAQGEQNSKLILESWFALFLHWKRCIKLCQGFFWNSKSFGFWKASASSIQCSWIQLIGHQTNTELSFWIGKIILLTTTKAQTSIKSWISLNNYSTKALKFRQTYGFLYQFRSNATISILWKHSQRAKGYNVSHGSTILCLNFRFGVDNAAYQLSVRRDSNKIQWGKIVTTVS